MRIFLAAAVLALLPLIAIADEGSVITYTSIDYDFTLALPGGGLISDPASDPEWAEDDVTVFHWEALNPASPIAMLTGTASILDADATDDDVSGFMTGMLEEFGKDESTSETSVNDTFVLGNRGWASVVVHDTGNAKPIWYEIFVTRQGPAIYAVICYYGPEQGDGPALARDVLTTFTTSGG